MPNNWWKFFEKILKVLKSFSGRDCGPRYVIALTFGSYRKALGNKSTSELIQMGT